MPPLASITCAPVVVEGLLQKEGLFDVHASDCLIACPSVFSQIQWVKQGLSHPELLRTWGVPLAMDQHLTDEKVLTLVSQTLTPLMVLAII